MLFRNQEGKTPHGWLGSGRKNITKIYTEYRHVSADETVRFLEVRRKSNFAQVVIKFMADYICVYTHMLYYFIYSHILSHTVLLLIIVNVEKK